MAPPPYTVESKAPEPYSSFLIYCSLQMHRSLCQGQQPSSMCWKEDTRKPIFSQRGDFRQ